VRTHVALLRGINVGGKNKLAMADLRAITESLGVSDVASYIQSGNVVFGCSGGSSAELAVRLERAITDRSDVHPGVVILSREDLASVIAGNPYPEETNPKALHVVFHREPIDPKATAAVQAAVERAQAAGSRDEATVVGSTLYLRTPDGLGRSALGAALTRPGATGAGAVATARNWATVTKLAALLDE
jgi:uncharacterized protein (DUF1697 family)